MSSRQAIIDAATRHQVFLQRYGGQQSKEAVRALNKLRRDIVVRINQAGTTIRAQQLGAMLQEIESLAKAAMTDITSNAVIGMQNLALSESKFSVELFEKTTKAAFSSPSTEALIGAVENSPMAAPAGMASVSISTAYKDFSQKKVAEITQAIRDGVALGDSTGVIADKLATTMTTLTRRQLETLVRTSTNHISAMARNKVYEQNSDILDGYQWVSTLDGRTTMICASRDGKVYSTGSGPVPPAHWGCRSTTIPKVKPEFDLGSKVTGQRASKGAIGAKAVSGKTTYGGWLRQQPREFIDEALGPERSKLFRTGQLKIDQFVDPTGRVYTLQQLEQMNPFVFQDL